MARLVVSPWSIEAVSSIKKHARFSYETQNKIWLLPLLGLKNACFRSDLENDLRYPYQKQIANQKDPKRHLTSDTETPLLYFYRVGTKFLNSPKFLFLHHTFSEKPFTHLCFRTEILLHLPNESPCWSVGDCQKFVLFRKSYARLPNLLHIKHNDCKNGAKRSVRAWAFCPHLFVGLLSVWTKREGSAGSSNKDQKKNRKGKGAQRSNFSLPASF